ncbi:MFS transporter [Actinoallomurus iriomotensis]|uniref:MFS transporter n=1 Tax=Actinoallomurus iriomotensis TaxID=478107 RepID=A0A9W6S7S3_9ACTN|nr:MFS transporter [Actinoallomurus iriomotensis]GLY89910.1 MFS transporter [Actinoallomurus iriomotensis]
MTTVTPGTSAGSIADRLERLPNSRWHVRVRSLIGVVTFFEAFDQLLVSTALPVLTKQWHLTSGQATFAVTSGSVGMLAGAFAAGWLGDRIGRVRTVALGVAVTALASLALVFSPDLAFFAGLRFVQGIGIGGVVPVAATYISEIAKSRHRGRFVLLYELIFPAGLTSATLVASWVVPHWGWRAMFLIGAAPALVFAFLQRRVPESPRWLASRGRLSEAEQVISRIEQEVERATGRPLPDPDPAAAAEPTARGGLRDLFAGRYLRRTVVVAFLWFFGYFVNYGITAWLPTLYTKTFKLDLQTALDYNVVSNLAGLLGCLVVALVIDRVGRRPALVVGLAGAAVALLALAVSGTGSGGQVAVWASITSLFVYATNVSLYLYTPELYPTQSRALGASLGGVSNRLGVIVGPIVVGTIIGSGAGIATVFTVLGVVALAGALTALFAVETRGRTLEQLNS